MIPPLQLLPRHRTEDTLNLFFMGNSHRVMGETPANRASSRSHAVFTLTVTSEREEAAVEGAGNSGDGGGAGGGGGGDAADARGGTRTIVTRGELNLVDLAGCERMYKNDRYG